MSPKQAKTSNEMPESLKIVTDLMNKIMHKIGELGQRVIFRGEDRCYTNISSSLYRFHKDIFEKDIFEKDILKKEGQSQSKIMSEIQDTIIDNARSRFKIDPRRDEDILSELQHYGGKTNFIDFSHDVYIALFFACHGEYESDGRLILYPYNYQNNYKDIVKNNMVKNIRDRDFCFDPKITNNRIIFQKSVFVHAHQGTLAIDKDHIIKIEKSYKPKILDYLKKQHHIDENTIYNDLPGFIKNENNFGNAQKEFIEGCLAQNEGDQEKAIGHYEKAIEINPYYHEAYNNKGLAHYGLKEYDKAIESYKKVIEIKPDDYGAHYNMGVVYYSLEEYDEAMECYDKSIELKSDYYGAYNNIGAVYSKLEKNKEAIKWYDKAIDRKDDYHEAYNNKGSAYYELKEYDESMKWYKKAIEIKSDYYKAHYNMSRVYDKLKKYEKVIECYEKMLEINPDAHLIRFSISLIYKKLEKYEKSIELDKKAELKKDDYEAHYNRGNAHRDLEQYDRAIEWYKKAIEIKPDYYEAHYNRGNAYYDLEKYEKAIECFDKALEIKPDYYEAYNLMGLAYKGLGEFDRAIECFKKGLEVSPDDDLIRRSMRNNIEYILPHLRINHREAIKFYKKKIATNSADDKVHYNMGLAYKDLGEYEKAIECFKKALEIKPDDQGARYNINSAYAKLGQHGKAAEYFEKGPEILYNKSKSIFD